MLILPLQPSANVYWRHARGRTYKSDDARTYQTAVGWQCQALHLAPHTGPVAVTLHVYRARRSGDLDNKIKVCLDSLNGHLWNDDAQVVELHAYLHDDKFNPRVEVECIPK